MDRYSLAAACLLVTLTLGACEHAAESKAPEPHQPASLAAIAKEQPPESWAVPIADQPGLTNLNQVNDNLYRGAQPGKEGFAHLKAMGVRTVVNLRTSVSDAQHCREAGLEYVSIPMNVWEVNAEQLAEFLRVVTDPARLPVFVHCHRGADRTGVACASYRVVVEGWSKEQAIVEMTRGGYDFNPIWRNLLDLVRGLDVEAMREQIGLVHSGAAD